MRPKIDLWLTSYLQYHPLDWIHYVVKNLPKKIQSIFNKHGSLGILLQFIRKKLFEQMYSVSVIIRFAFDLSIIKVYEEAIVKVSLCFAFLSILYIKNTLIYFISKFRSLHRKLCYQYFLSCNKTADNRRSMWVCSLKLRKNFRGWRILFRHDMFIYVPV